MSDFLLIFPLLVRCSMISDVGAGYGSVVVCSCKIRSVPEIGSTGAVISSIPSLYSCSGLSDA